MPNDNLPATSAAPTNPTPFIAVSAHYHGCGETLRKARVALVRAGGSATEPQKVYALPEGATGAYVDMNGTIRWFMGDHKVQISVGIRCVGKFDNNESLEITEEDHPKPSSKTGKSTKSRQHPDADKLGSEPDDATQAEIAATTPAEMSDAQLQEVVEEHLDSSLNGPGDGKPAKAKKAPKAKKVKPELEEAKTDPDTGHQVIGAADEDGVARAEAKPSDFLMFIGSNNYSKADFIQEAKEQGISRRLPTHRLPSGLVIGVSRVFVAADGERKTDGTVSEVFGYFVPQRMEFINTTDDKQYAEIVAALKLRDDTKIIGSIEQEQPRKCGTRKEGGSYLVVDKADSPLQLLDKPAQYAGNHFRGMLRLSLDQTEAFTDGGTVDVLVNEKCMACDAAIKVSPDGHLRAERERRRIAKGEEPKWLLHCKKCAAEARKQQRAEDDGVQSADDSTDGAADGTD